MICRHITISRSAWSKKERANSLQVSCAFVNPYKVLQVSEDADPKEIKRAYRKLALRHHPDISEEPAAEQDFLRIQEAYEILTNKREASQADTSSNGWDFHDWYWDFTMSHRWDSHWKKQGRSGPSPFAATPSHRQQWQAQLGRLKQMAAFRRAQQQAAHQPQQDQSEHVWQDKPPEQQAEQPYPASNQHHFREQQGQCDSRINQQGHQTELHVDTEHSNQGWQQQQQGADQEMQFANSECLPQHPCNDDLQHAQSSETHSKSSYGLCTDSISAIADAHAREQHSCSPLDLSAAELSLLMHQLVEHGLAGHASCTSLESYRQMNSITGAALQHVQAINASHWVGTAAERDAFLAEDTGPEAMASEELHRSDVISSNAGMPQYAQKQDDNQGPGHQMPFEHAKASQAPPAEVDQITDNELSASDRQKNVVHRDDFVANGYSNCHSNGQSSFQTQHSQVQSQLAGLRRRAARKTTV